MSVVAEPTELSREDLQQVLETRVRQEFDMSLGEFAAALDDGRLDADEPRVAGLAILVGARAG